MDVEYEDSNGYECSAEERELQSEELVREEKELNDSKLRMKSIREDLLKLRFPEEVKDRADGIHRLMGGETNRRHKRELRILFCLCNAHIELDRRIPPEEVASIMGLTRKDWKKAFSTFASNSTYQPPICEFRAQEYVRFMCSLISIGNANLLDDIIAILDSVQRQDSSLSDLPPYTLAAGAISYYIETNGFDIPPSVIQQAFGLSAATITNTSKRVSAAHNL